MPSSASIGNIRRGPQKAHIPYRGDNPQVGKKTGIAVQHVERKSDGFEPFEEIMQSADGLTPPQRRGWKKSLAVQQEEEDGEQSMQIDSPVQHLANLRPPVTPPTIGRRSSTRNGGPGPSGLSRTGSYREPEPPSDSPDREPDETGDQNVFGDYGPQEDDSPGKLPRETSFSQIEQDGDDDEEAQDPEETPKPARRLDKGKGKSKEVWHEPDEEAEDEIATELGGVDLEPESDASRDGRPRKNLRFTKDTVTRDKSQRKRGNKPQREGTRRSRRKPLKPLAYWRGERYVYGREGNHSGSILVPPIKEVIRIPEESPVPLSKKRKRSFSRLRSKSRGVEPVKEEIPHALPAINPEEGWDDQTEAKCVVLHYCTREEVERRIAWTAKMVQPKLSAETSWLFDKVFGDDDFILAGQIIIPPNESKPRKPTKESTYMFYVIEGAVNFTIHRTSMVVATGGMFMAPRRNFYTIENICDHDVRLFYVQAKKVAMDADEAASRRAQVAELQKRFSGRSSSVGAAPTALPNGRAASLADLPSSQ